VPDFEITDVPLHLTPPHLAWHRRSRILPSLLLKWTLKNLPPRRERKDLTASMAVFHSSLITQFAKRRSYAHFY